MDADVGILAREGGRHVVDVTAAMIVIDHPAGRHGALDQWQVQDRRQVGIRVAAGGRAIAGLHVALGHVQFRGVGDVADHTRLGSRAEQRPLRTLENLDAIQVRGVDVQIAVRQLPGLVVQVDGHVRPQAGRGAALARLRACRQAAHEDLVLAGAVVRGRDVGQILDVVVEGLHVQLLQGLGGKGLHGDRHVLHVLRAALRRYGDLLQGLGRRARRCITGVSRRCRRCARECRAAQDGRYRKRDLRVHCLIPSGLESAPRGAGAPHAGDCAGVIGCT